MSFQIGAAREEIVITEDMFPFGFGRGMSFTGIHDPLFVRVILLQNPQTTVLLIGLDLDSMGHIDFWKQKIRQVIDIPEENIYMMATHNHESIHIRNDKDDAPEGDADTAKSEALVWSALEKALRGAQSRLQPGRVCFDTGLCDININREVQYQGGYMIGRNLHGPSDKTVALLRFEDLQGHPLAFFINYAVHGSIMAEMEGAGEMLISGDLPGRTSAIVETYYGPDVVAVWTSGAAGNQDARYRAVRILPDENGRPYYGNYGTDAGYALIDMQARDLAEEVIRVSEQMQPGSAEAVLQSRQTVCVVPGKDHGRGPMGPGGPGDTGGAVGPGGPGGPGPGMMGPRPVEPEEDPQHPRDLESETEDRVTVHVGLLQIGDTVLSCYSGEQTYELGQMVKRALGEHAPHVVVVSHCNGYIGYMADVTGFERRVRSALVSLLAKGQAEKVVVSTPLRLAKEMGL